MLKKTIEYTDYNGLKRKEDHYFNLSKSELTEMELTTVGGFSAMVKGIVDAQDQPAILKIFKDMILKSYGKKHPDGIRFEKSDEISTAFSQTEAYNVLFMELISDSKKAAEFVNELIPADLAAEARKEAAKLEAEVAVDATELLPD